MLWTLLWIGIVLMSIRIRIRPFHFDVDPDPDSDLYLDPDPTSSYTQVGKSGIFWGFYSQQCQFKLFYLSHQCPMRHIFQYGILDKHIETFLKKVFCLYRQSG
jgi:hypothetical protein